MPTLRRATTLAGSLNRELASSAVVSYGSSDWPKRGRAMLKVTSGSTEITWDSVKRVADVRYTAGATLTRKDGDFLVDALTGWVGSRGEPFGVFADAAGLGGTDGEYRARASEFFRKRRETVAIALINLGPVIHVVVELFRLGTGIQLKTFANEAAARSWLRSQSGRA
jgi:hypothetical protein